MHEVCKIQVRCFLELYACKLFHENVSDHTLGPVLDYHHLSCIYTSHKFRVCMLSDLSWLTWQKTLLADMVFQCNPELAQVILRNGLKKLQSLLRERHNQRSELRLQQEKEMTLLTWKHKGKLKLQNRLMQPMKLIFIHVFAVIGPKETIQALQPDVIINVATAGGFKE
ncbi:DNA damage-inducible protein 1 [Artemisia annua]|uniref:DNA damage-inducible protein 1 n=1 Tax=Artemisia annua TaxID=35608 RepID=A0A2U1MKN2_ARTAN|nr:DNA damage-inducible protein 1 [Artemisia annua]